jgi:hypothetical protein
MKMQVNVCDPVPATKTKQSSAGMKCRWMPEIRRIHLRSGGYSNKNKTNKNNCRQNEMHVDV